MTMICHQLNYNIPEDVAFGEARVRAQSAAAEDFLHDMGAISIFGTDTQGMGRLAENVANCWQLASVMKQRVGRLPEETTARADNERIKRYVAKLTINPAIAVGIDAHVGSIEVGKMADLVLWPRASFGIKPYMVIKSGFIVWAAMGDGNGSLGLAEPMIQKRMWGALGAAPQQLGVNFVSQARRRGRRRAASSASARRMVPIKNVRGLRKTDMVRNAAMPHVEVDPQTFEVRADGKLLMCEPADDGAARPEIHAAMSAAEPRRATDRGRPRRDRRPGRVGQDGAGRAADPGAAWRAASISRSSPTISSPPRTRSASGAPGLIDPARVSAVEAGACPHTVIREDPTLNIEAADDLERRFPGRRTDPDRERRRQSRLDLLARPHRLLDVRDRRRAAATTSRASAAPA